MGEEISGLWEHETSLLTSEPSCEKKFSVPYVYNDREGGESDAKNCNQKSTIVKICTELYLQD